MKVERSDTNLLAMEAVLSILLWAPRELNEVQFSLDPQDFYGDHALLYARMLEQLRTRDVMDPSQLINDDRLGALARELYNESGPAPSISGLNANVAVVAKLAIDTRFVLKSDELQRGVLDGHLDSTAALDQLVAAHQAENYLEDSSGYLVNIEDHTVAESRPWVIPGLLRAGTRMMFVGPEGKGKSTLLAQIALNAAAGLHPFRTDNEIKPVRVLYVDAENNPDNQRDEQNRILRHTMFGQYRALAKSDLIEMDPNNLQLWTEDSGIDLRSRRDIRKMESAIRDWDIQLVVAGPIYKLFRRGDDDDHETLANEAQLMFDRLRGQYDVALVLEHHAAHGGKSRSMIPYGSSLWLRWPDVGVSLNLDGEDFSVDRFRGDRLTVRGLPDFLIRSESSKDHRPWLSEWKSEK